MAKIAALTNRFTFGEVSPFLYGRTDLDKYSAGCKTMENFIPLLQGPAARRGGTRFIDYAGRREYASPPLLIPFTRSAEVAYIIELGEGINAAGERQGYATFLHNGSRLLNDDGTPYSVPVPWLSDNLYDSNGIPKLKWSQSADVLFVVCPDTRPFRLSRYGHRDWRLSTLPGWGSRGNPQAITLWRERLVLAVGHTLYFSQSGALANFEIPADKFLWAQVVSGNISAVSATAISILVPNAITANVSFRAGEAAWAGSGSSYTATATDAEVGISRLEISITGYGQYGYYLDLTSSSSIAMGWLDKNGSPAGTAAYIYFDATTTEATSNVGGGGLALRARTDVLASDDPMEIEVFSDQLDDVTWLSPAEDLLVGTKSGEFSVGPQSSSDPVGPENVKIVPETSYGSSDLAAVRVSSVLFFAQRAGKKVRQFLYDYYSDNYQAKDVTAQAEHITGTGLVAMAWQSEPYETIWCVRADGQLVGLTVSRDQEMEAWHRHVIGGNGKIVNIAVLPSLQDSVNGGRDELYLAVKRELNGSAVYYIERMELGHELGGLQSDCFFVDAGVTVRGEGLTVIDGLEHLEGMEVAILGDGGNQPSVIVKDGQAKLRYAANVVQVGLPYVSKLQLLNFETVLRDGTIQGRTKAVSNVILRLIETLGGAVGPTENNLNEIKYRIGTDEFEAPPPLFTGDKKITWPTGHRVDVTPTVIQTYPLPFIVSAIIPEIAIPELVS